MELSYPVNISTPQSFALDDIEQFKKDHFPADSGNLVVVRFMLGIENVLKSEFVNVMSVDLARELLAGFEMNFGAPEEKSKTEAAPVSAQETQSAPSAPAQEAPAAQPVPAQEAPAAQGSGTVLSQAEIERLLAANGAPASGQPATQEPVPQTVPTAQPAPAQPAPAVPAQPVYVPEPSSR